MVSMVPCGFRDTRPYGRRAAIAIALMGFGMLRAAAAEPPVRLLALGDSLTAGYGLPPGEGFVPRLQAALAAAGRSVRVIDAGVSGDTTAGGLARLDWALADQPQAVLVELGGNDGLRGLPLATSRENLRKSIELARAAQARVLLVGMMIPPNYGQRYAKEFQDMFTTLASSHSIALVPFLLDKVALNPELMQNDGIHANAKGQPQMLENVWPTLKPLLVAPGKPAS